MTNRSSKRLHCPKCQQEVLQIQVYGSTARATCPACGFRTGWVTVPARRTPRGYLASRCHRIRSAYRRVRGQVPL